MSRSILPSAAVPLAALILSGCTSPPFSTSSAPEKTAHLAASIGTADLPPPEDTFLNHSTLDGERLAAEVLRRHPTLESLRGLWRAAGERPAQATALDDPALSYALAPASIGSGSVDFGQDIAASQSIPWPGKLLLRGEMARSEASAALETLEDARRLLANTARAAFYDWFLVHRSLEINAANYQLLEDAQKLAEDKYATGKTNKQDALQAEVERHHLAHDGIRLERQRRVLQARINTLLHRPTDAALPPPPSSLPAPQAVPALAGVQTRAVNARPELKALSHQVEARRAGVELARLDFRPDFTVMASYNSMWSDPDHRGMIGAGINIPIGKDRRAALREREAELDATQAAFAAAVDKVALDVAEAREELVESHHVVELYRGKILPAAEAHFDAARADYAAGKADILALLSAEKNVRTARLGVQRALADYHTRRAALDAAAGEGF